MCFEVLVFYTAVKSRTHGFSPTAHTDLKHLVPQTSWSWGTTFAWGAWLSFLCYQVVWVPLVSSRNFPWQQLCGNKSVERSHVLSSSHSTGSAYAVDLQRLTTDNPQPSFWYALAPGTMPPQAQQQQLPGERRSVGGSDCSIPEFV